MPDQKKGLTATLQSEQLQLIRQWSSEAYKDFKIGENVDANKKVVDIYLSYVNNCVWAAIKANVDVENLHELRESLMSLGSILRGHKTRTD